MRFTLMFLIGAAAASLTGSSVKKGADLVRRDGATVQSAIAAISAGTDALTAAVNAFNGAGDAAALQQAATDLANTIAAQTELVAATTELTGDEAIALVGPIQALGNTVQTSINAAIAKKPTFDAAGVSAIVLSTLTTLRDLSQTFSNTTIGKVPAALQSTATQLAAPIIAALQQGIDAFAGAAVTSTVSVTLSTTAVSSTTTFSSTFAISGNPVSSTRASTNNTAGGVGTSTGATGASPTSGKGSGNGTTKAISPVYTGEAIVYGAGNAAGFGALAMAALAAVAAF